MGAERFHRTQKARRDGAAVRSVTRRTKNVRKKKQGRFVRNDGRLAVGRAKARRYKKKQVPRFARNDKTRKRAPATVGGRYMSRALAGAGSMCHEVNTRLKAAAT